MLPKIAEVGKLWAEPEIRYTPAGKAVCTLPLVFSKSKKTENGGWTDDGTFWVRGTVWDTQAENCANTLSKGDKVLVIGELCEDEYEDKKTGEKRKSIKLKVFDIGPSLKFNAATISRAERLSKQDAPVDDPWATDNTSEAPF